MWSGMVGNLTRIVSFLISRSTRDFPRDGGVCRVAGAVFFSLTLASFAKTQQHGLRGRSCRDDEQVVGDGGAWEVIRSARMGG